MILAVLDGEGLYGTFFNYAFTVALVGSAILIFIYLWYKGRLDLDEEPKMTMMKADEGVEDADE